MGGLKRLFEPESVALVAVSRDPEKLSHMLMRNLVDVGPRARIYPVSRTRGSILGFDSYPSLRELPEAPDLVLISVTSDQVKNAITEAAEIGAGVAVVLSSGFGETRHGSGKQLERELLHIARGHGMRILGPNCLGIYNGHSHLNGSYLVQPVLHRGNISLVSQSGAFVGILVNELNTYGLGLASFASTGNQIDIRHQEVLEHLAEDPHTDVIGLIVEGIKDGPGFLSTLKRVTSTKPVVVFQIGRTSVGRRAAASHTGSLAGQFSIVRAAVNQGGAILAATSEDFRDALFTFSCNVDRLPQRSSVAIITISGGPSVAASDYCEEIGLSVPRLRDEVRHELSGYLPTFAADSNPVDMTVATRAEHFGPAVDVIMREPNIAGAIAVNWGFDRPEFAQAFVDAMQKYKKPVVAFVVENPSVQAIFRQHGILMLPSPERAARSYRVLCDYAKVRRIT